MKIAVKIFVEKYRLEQKLTLAELARRSGVAVSHIHNIENGNSDMTLTTLCKLAKALNVPACNLFSCD